MFFLVPPKKGKSICLLRQRRKSLKREKRATVGSAGGGKGRGKEVTPHALERRKGEREKKKRELYRYRKLWKERVTRSRILSREKKTQLPKPTEEKKKRLDIRACGGGCLKKKSPEPGKKKGKGGSLPSERSSSKEGGPERKSVGVPAGGKKARGPPRRERKGGKLFLRN